MNDAKWCWFGLTTVAIMIAGGIPQELKTPKALVAKPAIQGASEDDSRIEKLERRVELLEKIVFSSTRLNAIQAQRQVDDAQERLDHTKSLFAKGFIQASEVEQDRYRLEQAKKELELAKAETKQDELVGEMDVLQAERQLRELEQQLSYTKRLAERGYVHEKSVEAWKAAVELAKRELESAKTRLNATRKLESQRK
jgi:multidrug resistance efflux pump